MIDPTLTPTDQWQARMLARAEVLGVVVRRLRPDGDAVEAIGPAGRVAATHLEYLSRGDVERVAGVRL